MMGWKPAIAAAAVGLTTAGATLPAQQIGQSAATLPRVIAADVPMYPREAANAGVAGALSVKVTTDGLRVTSVQWIPTATTASVLADATLRNVNTWRFSRHAPTTFDASFKYTIVDRSCALLGRDTHAAAVIQFPAQIEVFAERDPACPGATRQAPVFGIYMHRATVPFFPEDARAKGIDGKVTIGVTYKGVLSLDDGPEELGDPLIELIRDWMLVPGPYSEQLKFTFKLVDGDCRSGPNVVVGPGLTSYEVTDARSCGR